MIKKIIAMASCLAIVFAFAGCEKDGEDKSSSKTTTTTTEPAVTEEITDEELTDALDSDIADINVDDVDDDSNVDIVDGVIETSDYTITVGDNWNLITGADTVVFLTRKGESLDEMSANISIVSSSMYSGLSISQAFDMMTSQYASLDNYEVESSNQTKIDNCDAIEIVYNDTESKMKLLYTVVLRENSGIIFSYTANDSYYDQTIDEVNGIINSITIK